MRLARSWVFAVWLVTSVAIVGLLGAPIVFMRKDGADRVMRFWASIVLFGARWICGIRVEVRGREHLPAGPFMIASKHQGMLDTVAPFVFLDLPSFVLKQELLKLPVFGWYASKGMIPIDRDGQMAALKAMVAVARERLAAGRQVIIYPEGTRQPVGAAPDYKPGVAAIYSMLDVPCVPMALNTGLVWPAKGILKNPGVAVFEFLPVIPPGLKRPVFMQHLEQSIETASAALAAEEAEKRS